MNIDNFTKNYKIFLNKPLYRYEQESILRKNLKNANPADELVIVMEELAELTQQISKKLRGEENKMHLLEEIADVDICLEQLKLLCGFTDKEIEAARSVKLHRLNTGNN